jgi:hypothetical protein
MGMLLYCRLSANDRSKLYLVFELVLEIRKSGTWIWEYDF